MANILIKKHALQNYGRQQFVAGGQIIYDILRGGFIQRIRHRMNGSLVIAAGSTSGTSLGVNPGNLISNFKMLASPIGQIKSLSPSSVVRSTVFDLGRIENDTALTGGTGTFTINQDFWLQFSPTMWRDLIGSALESDQFSSIQSIIQLGSRDTQFSGNDRTFTYSGVNIDYTDQREFADGHTSLLFENEFIKQITAANATFNVTDFTVGRRVMSYLLQAETTNQALANTILNRARFQSASAVFADTYAADYQSDSQRFITEADSAVTGLYFIPLSPDLTIGGAVDARGLNQLSAVLDVSNPGTDQIRFMERTLLTAADLGLVPAQAA